MPHWGALTVQSGPPAHSSSAGDGRQGSRFRAAIATSLPGDLHPKEAQEYFATRPVLRILLRAPNVEVIGQALRRTDIFKVPECGVRHVGQVAQIVYGRSAWNAATSSRCSAAREEMRSSGKSVASGSRMSSSTSPGDLLDILEHRNPRFASTHRTRPI